MIKTYCSNIQKKRGKYEQFIGEEITKGRGIKNIKKGGGERNLARIYLPANIFHLCWAYPRKYCSDFDYND